MSGIDINISTDPGGMAFLTSPPDEISLGWIPNSTFAPDSNTSTGCVWNFTSNSTMCMNSTVETDPGGSSSDVLPMWLNIALAILAGSISIVTILGNLTVVLAFGIERSIRQPTNYFLASLAVSDLLIGTFSMPLFTQYILLNYWALGPWLCDLWLSLDWTVCLTSQYTVFLITTDRFLSVKIPAKYRNWRTERKVWIMIAMTWILPTLIFFISIVGWQFFVPEGRTVAENVCEVQFMNDPLFTFMLTIGYYWITLVVMCILYGLIYSVALNLQRKSDAKHKRLQTTMELAAESAARNNLSNSSDSPLPSKKRKKSKKTKDNNVMPVPKGVTTTSFSKKNSSEKDEDRSSSPAFASDDDNSSSQGACGTSKPSSCSATANLVKAVDRTGFINNALLPDSGKFVRKVDSAQNGGSRDHNLLSPAGFDKNPIRCDFISEFETSCMVTEQTDLENIFSPPPVEISKSEKPSVPLLQNDILKGIRFIDDQSFNSLPSDNVKLLSDSQPSEPEQKEEDDDKQSPVWRRRESFPTPKVTIDEAKPASDDAGQTDLTVPLAVGETTTLQPKDHCTAVESHGLEGNNLSPADYTDDKSDVRLSAAQRRRNRKNGKFQNFVKSVRSRNSRRRNRRERKSKSENRARKALRTITLILGAFVLCWTPYHIMVFVIAIAGYDGINIRLYNFTYWLCYLNSPINPFCYAFANVQFKRTFLRIFKLDWHKT
ncbi:muscarinic acetylcholine receptor M3-like [Gigantopelta aegis]|uniref:muscarinic acetylcholine receptor M3-like n=1 Tax=Gigantopelta aegis TaxID=1735272 RepID=UPI001B88DC15|nr:muscarinic acetylcholine receptor M3-like [Gigantopelta aegis]XP_041372205.1 muscarinic acetylcholine receptor M3-like [Gigantopelta aegis]